MEGNRFAEGADTEASVDRFLWSGHFDEAREHIDNAIEERQKRHHLQLKRVAIPFYNLVLNGVTEQHIEQAMDVYGEAATLLDEEMAYFAQTVEGDDREASRGRITELAIFCLQARDLQWQEPVVVLLPATQEDDRNGRCGTDYYLTGIRDGQTYPYPIQTKTRVTEEHQEYYDSSIKLVGLDQLDGAYGRPPHYNSLANTLLRDINGQASASDTKLLDKATVKLYEAVITEDSVQQLAA